MTDAIGWISSIFAMPIATVGSVSVTLGLLAAVSLIFGLGVSAFKRVRGRG